MGPCRLRDTLAGEQGLLQPGPVFRGCNSLARGPGEPLGCGGATTDPRQTAGLRGNEEKQRLPHPQPSPGAPGPEGAAEALCKLWAAGMFLGSLPGAWVSG